MSAVHSTERIKLVGVLVGTGSAVRSKEEDWEGQGRYRTDQACGEVKGRGT